ncbi:hypothetical protein [Butyrivibrio sp. AE3003]|uniref:hypothetical protein n=1 Tax=Butyrivibrio sp. AE3003 TaxID=1496721 RepID=UPI001A9845A5|nr:hypothetical protein [Butyrivibrio sp. AE3003]
MKNIFLGAGKLFHAHIGASEASHIPLGLLITSIFPGIKSGLESNATLEGHCDGE